MLVRRIILVILVLVVILGVGFVAWNSVAPSFTKSSGTNSNSGSKVIEQSESTSYFPIKPNLQSVKNASVNYTMVGVIKKVTDDKRKSVIVNIPGAGDTIFYITNETELVEGPQDTTRKFEDLSAGKNVRVSARYDLKKGVWSTTRIKVETATGERAASSSASPR